MAWIISWNWSNRYIVYWYAFNFEILFLIYIVVAFYVQSDCRLTLRCWNSNARSHYWSNNIFNWSNYRAFNYKVCAFYYPLTFKSICQFLLYLSLNCHISLYVVIIYNMFVPICCVLHFVLSTDNYYLQ